MNRMVLFALICFILAGIFIVASSRKVKLERENGISKMIVAVKGYMEYAYFEGQRDALNNDVRIKVNESGQWEWVKSPWDGEQLSTIIYTNLPMKDSNGTNDIQR